MVTGMRHSATGSKFSRTKPNSDSISFHSSIYTFWSHLSVFISQSTLSYMLITIIKNCFIN